jgi:DNA processing protein
MTGPEALARIMLRRLPGVGDRTHARMIQQWGSARRALEAIDSGEVEGAQAMKVSLQEGGAEREAREILARVGRSETTILFRGVGAYPERLEHLHDPPALLFVRGRSELLSAPRAMAMVGARTATAVGRRAAERIARQLSDAGVLVVSGMALGIDAAAHRGALEGPGGTLAVLGRGPDRAYPLQNADLFRSVALKGCLVSEFPPGERALPSNFPRRNRIIAALAHGVLVVEAGRESGAMITVTHAEAIGRDVMVVPGSVESPQSTGSNALLQTGAYPVMDATDVLSWFKWDQEEVPSGGEGDLFTASDEWGSSEVGTPASQLMKQLAESMAPRSLDWLLAGTALTTGEALSTLTRLELEGRIRREAEGWTVVREVAGR